MTALYKVKKINKNGVCDNAHSLGPFSDLVDAEREYLRAIETSKCKAVKLVAYCGHCTKTLYEKELDASRCVCAKCHGHFRPSQMTIYHGRSMCEECVGDEAMYDTIAWQERALDDYLASQE